MVRVVYVEIAAQIRDLITAIPPMTAPLHLWANWLVRKAEVLELIAVADPVMAPEARELADRDRKRAHRISEQLRQQGRS